MNLFESLKDSAGGLIGGEAHQALTSALGNSQLGDMSGLLDKLHEGGLGDAVDAWAQGDEHPPVSADDLHKALGDEHVQALASSMGIAPDALLAGLSEHLPALAADHHAEPDDEAEAADAGEAEDHEEAEPDHHDDEPSTDEDGATDADEDGAPAASEAAAPADA